MAISISSVLAQEEAKREFTLALDNSYPTGGYSISASLLGLSAFTRIKAVIDGYEAIPVYQTDPSTVKLKISRLAPTGTISAPNTQNSIDEVIAVTAGTGVSAAVTSIPVTAVESVYVTAGGVTGVFKIIPNSATLATTLVKINRTTGVFTFLIADAVTSATITYVKQATTVPVFSGTAASFTEVTNATDLSALTGIRVEAYGSL